LRRAHHPYAQGAAALGRAFPQRGGAAPGAHRLIAFRAKYNASWIVERHGYLTPAQVRAELALKEVA
jgi:hypothetical protein